MTDFRLTFALTLYLRYIPPSRFSKEVVLDVLHPLPGMKEAQIQNEVLCIVERLSIKWL